MLENPKTFSEKLQWLKLYDRNQEYTKMVDKYQVREYIKEQLGEEYLIPLIGVYDSFDEIDFENLPAKFVLKCTHDSGGLVICKDKSKLNIKKAKQKIKRSLQRNYYDPTREWPYKNVKPRLVCEKYMVDESGIELKDYKIFCFNGEPKVIQVDFDRFNGHKRNFYDTNWNYIAVEYKYPTYSEKEFKKPEKLKDMVKFAKILSKGISFIRIDFYLINSKVYFGEITFYPESGFGKFIPESYNELLGTWMDLPKTKVKQ
ncbi:MAG: ATP-grasp fold amidoligase family protein [Cyclobacteriaceae bacterium]